MLFSALLFASSARAAIPFEWDVREGAQHRWVMESEIALPGHVWLYADQNIDVRARSLRVQLVLDCTADSIRGLFRCNVEQASLAGETYPSEYGLLKPVLDELDAKLTGSELTFTLGHDGRLRSTTVSLNQLQQGRNRRTRYTAEMVRMLVQRTLSPIDLQVPRAGLEEGGWPQYHAASLQLLTLQGTAGGGRLVHHAQPWGDGLTMVSTAGEATMVDGANVDLRPLLFSTQITGHMVLDSKRGTIREAHWEIYGEPTASAGVSANYHASRIQIRALRPDEPVVLSPNEEWTSLRG